MQERKVLCARTHGLPQEDSLHHQRMGHGLLRNNRGLRRDFDEQAQEGWHGTREEYDAVSNAPKCLSAALDSMRKSRVLVKKVYKSHFRND